MEAIKVREDIGAVELREVAKREKKGRVCRRLLALAHLLEGGSREEAEKIACLTSSNFRVWVKRYNELGIEGLVDIKPPGRPHKMSDKVKEELRTKVLKGPSKGEKIVRYRLVDLKNYLEKEHKIRMGLSGIWYELKGLKLSWKTGRQRHPKSEEAIQEAFKKKSLSDLRGFKRSILGKA
jgi:transposase